MYWHNALTNLGILYKIKYNLFLNTVYIAKTWFAQIEKAIYMEKITKKAYAKINLGLDVLRRRPDGYHEVKMIMQTVDIHDTLTFGVGTQPGIVLNIDNNELPAGSDNLIYKAAERLLEESGIKQGVEIFLEKKIPIAAGMAGGSSDAAVTLHGLNELFGLGYSLEELQKIGVKLGADIPYCLMGGTALSEGIGEVLTKLPNSPQCTLVIAKPDINVSTKFVYENLHADSLTYHPDIDGMVAAINDGSLSGITDRLGNVLETVTIREYPIINEIKTMMKDEGAQGALMSGSGPTVFGIFADAKTAKNAAKQIAIEELAKQVFVTRFI